MNTQSQQGNNSRFLKVKSTDIFNPFRYGKVDEEPIGVYVGDKNIIFFNLPYAEALSSTYGNGSKAIFPESGKYLLGANFGEGVHQFAKKRLGDDALNKQVFTYRISESRNSKAFVEFILHVHEFRAPDIVFTYDYPRDRIVAAQELEDDLAAVNKFLCVKVVLPEPGLGGFGL